MSVSIVVGAQWGDEGKGKIVDALAERADYVVRFQGGANAGHTLVVKGEKTVLHLIPSGILHPQATCIIASGCVIDIEGVIIEIEKLQAAGVLTQAKQLQISDSATALLPFHKKLDAAREIALGNQKIGTTGKGIGPAYEDRAARRAILLSDLFNPELLKKKLERNLEEKNVLLKAHYNQEPIQIEPLLKQCEVWAEKLRPFRCKDVSLQLNKAIVNRKKILFEGAQGTLLDVLHGTVPFVTSSSTIAASACTGTGIGPNQVQSVIGIAKAYATRVGSGPFPTELDNEIGEKIRKEGFEFGSTTGRPRRTGWLDLVALKYAIRLNGINSIALMKIDVLSGHKEVGVCTAYKINGEITHDFPTNAEDLEKVEPVIEYLPGWTQDITKVTSLKDLPLATTKYIDFIGKNLGTPIDVISVGPGREQTLWIKPLFI